MTQQEKDELNKELCQLLGICWHEEDCRWDVGSDDKEILRFQCTCKRSSFDKRGFTKHCKKSNHDFTSEAGRVQLLKLIRLRAGFSQFVRDVGNGEGEFKAFLLILELFHDDNGAFAIAARDFLKAMRGGNHSGEVNKKGEHENRG
jgi:hypothetical protein